VEAAGSAPSGAPPSPSHPQPPQAAQIKSGLDIFGIPAPPYAPLAAMEARLELLGRMWGVAQEWRAAYTRGKETQLADIQVGRGGARRVGRAGDWWKAGACAVGCRRQGLAGLTTCRAAAQVEALEESAAAIVKSLAKLPKECRAWPVCDSVREAVEAFKRTLPLITDLRSPAMKPRHWQQLREHIGRE
jgi:dynein heavy chain